MPGTLAAVGQMGYQGVEFAGYYGRKARELRQMLDQSGLKCCGTHTALETLTGNALKGTVEFNQTLGNKFLIVPWLPPSITTSLAALIDAAKLLTDLADKVHDLGMRVGYHAHAHDFKPVADRIPWEVLFTNAGPDVVMQMDIGNCLDGGGDPVAESEEVPPPLGHHSSEGAWRSAGCGHRPGRRAMERNLPGLRNHRWHRVVHRRAGKLPRLAAEKRQALSGEPPQDGEVSLCLVPL